MLDTIRKLRSQKGFTGIEVLIVLVIVTIIVILVTNKIGESQAEARDIERRADIIAMQNSLESHWHEHESYPVSLNNIIEDISIITDPSGNIVLNSEEEIKPTHAYTASKPEQEYTYSVYECNQAEQEVENQEVEAEESSTENQDEEAQTEEEVENPPQIICSKYVIYGWLEQGGVYERNNLHNIDSEN